MRFAAVRHVEKRIALAANLGLAIELGQRNDALAFKHDATHLSVRVRVRV